MNYRRVLFGGVVGCAGVLLGETAVAQVAPGDAITEAYQGAAGLWLTRLRPIAHQLFYALAGIEFAVSAIVWGLSEDYTFDRTLGKFILKVLVVSFMFLLLIFFDTWIPVIIDSFAGAGASAAGVAALNPTQVLEKGLTLSYDLLRAVWAKGLLAVLTAEGLVAVVASTLVLIAFALVAAQLIMTIIESYLVMTAGIFFIGFAAFRGTSSFTDRYLVWAFAVGIRLFLLYLLIGAGLGLVDVWIGDIEAMPHFTFIPANRVVLGSIVFALIVLILPRQVSRQLTSGASFGIAGALRNS